MRFGPKCDPGFLPVYSVGSEKEAKSLLIFACGTNLQNEFVARELLNEQTLENLEAFSVRLHQAHKLLVKNGRCDCSPSKKSEQ